MFTGPITRAATALALSAALFLGACSNGEDRPGQVTSETDNTGGGSVSASGPGPQSSGGTSAGSDGYKPVSSVDAHAAIGDDFAAIKDKLAAAKSGGAVDWNAVRTIWEKGGASKKGDGSNRTLKALVDAPDVVGHVEAGINGTGTSAADDKVRAQNVEKGITVLLARKVADELKTAADKVKAGQTAPADGAQKAAGAGDAAGLATAATKLQAALDYVFYLATHKYLGAADSVGRAEGASFYLGIAPRVRAADAEADKAITAAFASGDATAGRTALHKDAVLAALGVDATERVDKA